MSDIIGMYVNYLLMVTVITLNAITVSFLIIGDL